MARPFAVFPTSLRHYRELTGVNQRTVADLIGIPQPELSLIESGYCLPTPEMAARIADAIGTPETFIWPEDVRDLYVGGDR